MQKLRPLTPKDAQEVAELHHKGFASFFLTSLGLKFLEVFYASAFRHPNGFGTGLFDEKNKLQGFALGCYPSDGFYLSLMRNNLIRLGLAMMPAFLKSPAKLFHIIGAFKASERETVPSPTSATLLSICVLPSTKGKGLGKALLDGFEAQCRQRDSDTILLTTAAENNDAVNHFYQRNNYQIIETFVKAKSHKENVYAKKLQG